MVMSVDNLKNDLTNPARAYLWDIVIPNIPGGGDAESLEIRAFSTSIPGRGLGGIKLAYKGGPGMKVPGKITMSQSWPVVIREGTDKKVFEALNSWQETISGVKTGIGTLDPLLKANLYLKCLDPPGSTWLKIQMVGCYPEDVAEVPLSQDTEDVIMFSCTFSYDYWLEA